MFCAIALGAAAFVGTAVPETGGQTLEQIELAALGKTTSSSLELSDEGEKGSAGPGTPMRTGMRQWSVINRLGTCSTRRILVFSAHAPG